MTLIYVRASGMDGGGRCDSRCYNALGGRCSCVCKGRNHGQGLALGAVETCRAVVEGSVGLEHVSDRVLELGSDGVFIDVDDSGALVV
jgi:hypothetical protein